MCSHQGKTNQRLYRIFLSYRTMADGPPRAEDCRVLATEATKALQAVMSRLSGVEVMVATLERIVDMDETIKAE